MAQDRLVRTAEGAAVLEFDVDDGLSLYRPGSERVVVLNATARRIWELLEERPTAVQLLSRITADYGVDSAEVGDAVDDTVRALCDEGLIARDG